MTDRIEGIARQGVGHVQDAVGGLTGDGKTQVNGKINEAIGSAQSAYGQVKDQAGQAFGKAKDQAQDVFEDLTDYLSDQPLKALGIGLAIGFVLAVVLGSSSKTVYVDKR